MISLSLHKRCQKYGVKHIDRSLDLMTVYLKFNGKCQKCGILTCKGIHPQVPTSATIEHIIPLSMGGNHTKENATLYCNKCNMENNKEMIKRIIIEPKQYKINIFGFNITIIIIKKEQKNA